ncbi:hypothetical protein BC826DRAFT_1009767 [Russula brevipes]|nr:hypothetical protein BC826DRAFT_1009767 [Russula brevipes]
MPTIFVPVGFSWVAGSLLSVAILLQWQGLVVGGARGRARIPYPRMYAEKAEQESSKDALIFNCTQRAHQNTLERLPIIVLTTLISGVRFPALAATACGLWSLSRIVYTRGYGSGEPSKRNHPAHFGFLVETILSIVSGKVVFDLYKAGV